jgi:uncharacterized membrane protein YoaK (UPF0700 family)
MRPQTRIPAAAFSHRPAYPVASVTVLLVVVGLAAALATWHGAPWVVVVPVAVVLVGIALFRRARRALRRASARIDTILREELDRAE